MTEKSVRSGKQARKAAAAGPAALEIDACRSLVFPNGIRKFRKQRNIGSLLELAEQLPDITYIRLSKIERGEVFARAAEMRSIAVALHVDPVDLLVDIDDPDFDIEAWAEPILGNDRTDPEADRLAVLIAAALRARRAGDDSLTIATLEEDYGIAPVILSRIENAHKPFERWNEDVRTALRRLFDVPNDAALAELVASAQAHGELDAFLPLVANPELRIAKTRARTAALLEELSEGAAAGAAVPAAASAAKARNAAPRPPRPAMETSVLERPVPVLDEASRKSFAVGTADTVKAQAGKSPAHNQSAGSGTSLPAASRSTGGSASVRLVPVFGSPLPNGLLARTATDAQIEAPRSAGPRAYGLRIGRSTLGAGLPGRAVLVVDPDRFPSAGGLAVIEQDEGLRVIAITFDRQGHTLGFTLNPEFEIAIDDIDPARVATVLSAVFE